MKFNRFIAIDWSGRENIGRNLQVSQCFPGIAVPEIVKNGQSHKWRRSEVLDWLIKIIKQKERIIAGFDFAFAYPYCDEKAYFPGHKDSPKSIKSLWKVIDSICGGDFYGGPFYKRNNAKFSDYLLGPDYKGKKYSPRMRVTENHSAGQGGNPSSVFKCFGKGQVGSGSVAGMRFLHHINRILNGDFLIWPFQRLDSSRSLIVEIYPGFFYKKAGANSQVRQNSEKLNSILKFFNSEPASNLERKTEDQKDAIISAAAIRHFAVKQKTWNPDGLTGCARTYEGWIFGVA